MGYPKDNPTPDRLPQLARRILHCLFAANCLQIGDAIFCCHCAHHIHPFPLPGFLSPHLFAGCRCLIARKLDIKRTLLLLRDYQTKLLPICNPVTLTASDVVAQLRTGSLLFPGGCDNVRVTLYTRARARVKGKSLFVGRKWGICRLDSDKCIFHPPNRFYGLVTPSPPLFRTRKRCPGAGGISRVVLRCAVPQAQGIQQGAIYSDRLVPGRAGWVMQSGDVLIVMKQYKLDGPWSPLFSIRMQLSARVCVAYE